MCLVLLLVPVGANAQALATSWPGLQPDTLQTVYVLDDAGVETTGRLVAVTPDSLILWRDGAEQQLERRGIVRVQKRDSLKNGIIAGAVVGSVMGLLTAGISDCPSGSESGCLGTRSAFAVFSAVTYTGLGVGIDALIRGRTTVYRREPEGRQTTVSVGVSKARASLGIGVRW